MRFGAMFYYRTNREQFGTRNVLQPASEYTAFTINVPNGPGGTVQNPKPTHGHGLQHQSRGQLARAQRP